MHTVLLLLEELRLVIKKNKIQQ